MGLPEDFKQQVAERFCCPVWLLQQFNADANKKSEGAKMHMVDSAECRTFGENLAFCVAFGAINPDNKVGKIHYVKSRRKGVQGRYGFIRLVGELGYIVDVDDDYTVQGDSIVEKKLVQQIHGGQSTNQYGHHEVAISQFPYTNIANYLNG
jgi:hypothetical protein